MAKQERTLSLTDQDTWVLISFARHQQNESQINGASLTRMLTAGVVEYFTEKPKDDPKAIIAHNKAVLAPEIARAKEWAAQVEKMCMENPQMQDFDFDYRTKNRIKSVGKPCSKLRISAKGWKELGTIGVTQEAATSSCGK